MKKLLLVIDMQNDFVTGTLGSKDAENIVSNVQAKVKEYKENDYSIIFTRDTHFDNYLETQEGKNLPVVHCVKGTEGHEIIKELDTNGYEIFDKPSFGSLELSEKIAIDEYDEVELCGLCTDICVVSNAIILKAKLPETKVSVDPKCCAGVTVESHNAAITTMKMCQVNIID